MQLKKIPKEKLWSQRDQKPHGACWIEKLFKREPTAVRLTRFNDVTRTRNSIRRYT
jgi:hypothetical protein